MSAPLRPEGIAVAALAAPRAADTDDGLDAPRFVTHELTRLVTGLDPSEREALRLVVLASLVALDRGSTRLPVTRAAFRPHLRHLLEELGADAALVERVEALARAAERRDPRLSPLIGALEDHRPLVLEGGFLYHQRSRRLEQRVAERLAARLGPLHPPGTFDRIVADVDATPPRLGPRPQRLSAQQRRAVTAALEGGLSVISGGPGTGKTSIVVSILRALARRGDVPLDRVALAAPTGKAADRMRASVDDALRRVEQPALADLELLRGCPPARTLHRLLGYSPRLGRFRHQENNPLDVRFVVVDESSMIDLGLFERLLCALPDGCQLALLGDSDQLPSVDAGAVFRDLCDLGGARSVRLTRSYRMDPSDPAGRNVLTVARRVEAGDGPGCFEPTRRSKGDAAERVTVRAAVEDLVLRGAELVPGRMREALLRRWLAERVLSSPDHDARAGRWYRWTASGFEGEDARELSAICDHLDRSRVLCLTRRRATGVEGVNAWFHARALERAPDGPARGAALVPGEPVIVTRNDYERGLFNGDAGVVARTVDDRGDARLSVVFRSGGGFATHPLAALRPLVELAYAITVHKAQGSEYDDVALILPDGDPRVLTREVLYTAITRSRRSVTIVGDRETFERGVARRIERFSGLLDRLG